MPEKKKKKCIGKMHIDKRGVQLKLCATPRPLFQGQHLHRWLYASI